MNPYKETILENGVFRRIFSEDTKNSELVWHRDKEDRIIKIISETNWKLQIDNHLPILLEKNKEYKIPKNTFHRVIKGNGDLVIELTKIY